VSLKVLYIISLGHSGSTLLGNILDSHSKCIHAGELISPVTKKRRLVCMECIDDPCPIWGSLITQKDLEKNYSDFVGKDIISKAYKLLPLRRKNIIYDRILYAYPAKSVLIDSSKNISWSKYNVNNCKKKFQYRFIFLKRDVKAVFASYKRGYNQNVGDRLPYLNKSISKINDFYRSLSAELKVAVSYDELVEKPEGSLKHICDFLNLSYESDMLNFESMPHHICGGNQSGVIQKGTKKAKKLDSLIDFKTSADQLSYYSNLKGIKKDERWKSELTQEEKRNIDNTVTGFDF